MACVSRSLWSIELACRFKGHCNWVLCGATLLAVQPYLAKSMSSLIFYTEREQALIASDTLAVNLDGTPRMYTTKALIVPHLRMVIAGTGIAGLSTRWFARVN